jgi:hypothetical protein
MATTFQQLYDLTVEFTRRPELAALTQTAIRAATIRAHTSGFFFRDRYAELVSLTYDSSKAWVDVADVYSRLTNLRAVESVQMVQDLTDFPSEQLEYADPTDIYARNNNVRTGGLRTGIYTLDGQSLRLYPNFSTARCKINYYKLPVTTSVGFSSWIADTWPDDLAMWAGSIVHSRSGAIEQAKINLQTNVMPFKEMLMESCTIPTVN